MLSKQLPFWGPPPGSAELLNWVGGGGGREENQFSSFQSTTPSNGPPLPLLRPTSLITALNSCKNSPPHPEQWAAGVCLLPRAGNSWGWGVWGSSIPSNANTLCLPSPHPITEQKGKKALEVNPYRHLPLCSQPSYPKSLPRLLPTLSSQGSLYSPDLGKSLQAISP